MHATLGLLLMHGCIVACDIWATTIFNVLYYVHYLWILP
eukprot:SAG11_NODE_17685_length_511_cov_1.327670_1_plen_38_part_10